MTVHPGYLDRDDYEILADEYAVWSEVTQRHYYGQSLSHARNNRSEGERVLYQHRAKGNG